MSMKGDQNNRKHGGVHGSSHGYASLLKNIQHNDNQSVSSLQKPAIFISDQSGTNVSLLQDGVGDNHHELEPLIQNTGDDLPFGDGTGQPEWITTTVDELGNIHFSTLDDDPLLGLPGTSSHEPKLKISDAIIDAVERGSFDPSANFLDSNPHLKIKQEHGISVKSSPCSPVFIKSDGIVNGTSGRQRSFSDSEEQLTAQDRACLEEIERGSQWTQEDQELIEDSKQRLQLELQDFDTPTDKSSALMTAQELQSLQERGLDFDASDDPHSSELPDGAGSMSPTQMVQMPESPKEPSQAITFTTNTINNSTQVIIEGATGKQVFELESSDFDEMSNVRFLSNMQKIYVQDAEGEIAQKSIGPSQSKKKQKKVSQVPANTMKAYSVSHMCQECGTCFAKPFKLKLHMMMHRGEKPFKCTEPGCDWAFPTSYKLKRHMECHQGKKDFVCEFEGCGRKFTTIYNLTTHQKLHARPLLEHCPMEGCTEAFPNKKMRDNHLKTHGPEGKQYKCPHPGCNKLFFSEITMGSHKKMHQRTEPIRCEMDGCNKVFDKPSRLTAHMRTHTGERPYRCNVEGCNWRFPTASKLKRHISKHTGERKFECQHPGCGRAFQRSEHLKGHQVVHSKDKPFPCTVEGCNSSFTAKSSWYVHVKKHEQRRDAIVYHCPIDGCQRRYKDKGGLRGHIDRHYAKDGAGLLGVNTQKADILALVNGEMGALEAASGASQEELEQSLASISSPAPTLTSSPATATATAPSIPNGIIFTTPEGQQQFISYEHLIASGIDLSELGLIPDPDLTSTSAATSSKEDAMDTSSISVTMTTATLPVSAAPPVLTPAPQQSLLKRNYAQQQPLSTVPEKKSTKIEVDDGGCARTDVTRNFLLSNKAKERSKILKEKSHGGERDLDFVSLQSDVNSPLGLLEGADSLLCDTATTSQQLSIQDPETGVIYVQTQLLQDDPDTSSLLDEQSMTSLLHDPQLVSSAADDELMDTSVVYGSTINLHDLQA